MIRLTNLNMEEPEIIELSSDSDDEVVELASDSDDEYEDDVGIVNDTDANIHNYRTVTIIGPPVAMPHPAFMSWMKKATLFR